MLRGAIAEEGFAAVHRLTTAKALDDLTVERAGVTSSPA
jgi:hypothetical protein